MDHTISMESMGDLLWEEWQRELRSLAEAHPDLGHQHYDQAKRKKLRSSVRAAAEEGNVGGLMAALVGCCHEERSPLPVILEQRTLAGDTLLHVAAASVNRDVSRLLIDHFSDQQVIARNRRGDTALHVAASSGNLCAVKLLVQRVRRTWEFRDHDWMLWTKNNVGNTPLHEAVLNRMDDAVICLLNEDPKPLFWQNKQGKSALYLAVETGDLDILNLLLGITLEAGEDFASKVGGMSPVHAAVVSRRHDMIEAMWEKKPCLFRAKEFGGYTAMHLAVFTNYTEGVKFLLNKVPSLAFEYDEDGCLPIHVACKHSSIFIIRVLLQHCENPGDFLNKEGQNIIHVAAKYGRSAAMRYLLWNRKLEPLINRRDDGGNTAVHLAASYLQPWTLLDLTSDPRVKIALLNNECQAPMDIARSAETSHSLRKWMMYQILSSAGATGSMDLVIRPHDQMRKGRVWRFHQPPTVSQLKERINTQLIVAALIATVTFTAGFTVPGGFYGSDSSNKGLAILAGRSMFRAFVICNTIAMYSSMLVVVFLLWSLSSQDDPQPYWVSYAFSVLPLRAAILAMSGAFMTGVYPLLQKVHGFQNSILIISSIFIYLICGYSMMLIGPLGGKSWFIPPVRRFMVFTSISISIGNSPSPLIEKEEEERRLSKGGQLLKPSTEAPRAAGLAEIIYLHMYNLKFVFSKLKERDYVLSVVRRIAYFY